MAKKTSHNIVKDIFAPSKPKKGEKWLLPVEWSMVIYALFTLILVLFTSTNLHDADTMAWERVRVVLITVMLWASYRVWPCRFMIGIRILFLLILLSWWYPDTYELNRQFANLDHVFASWEQAVFGCQPALLWSQTMSSPIVSELMDFGYMMYFPMFAVFIIYLFFKDFDKMMRVAFVIITSFYIFYVIYDLLPVTGPQYYYLAAGIDNIAAGTFPDIGTYFATCQERMPSPGWEDGLFHRLLEAMHSEGERPTAAFPSSHVGVATITMYLAIKLREWRYAIIIAVPYLLLCLSTVYIQAHYAIDAIAGFIVAFPVAISLDLLYVRRIKKN